MSSQVYFDPGASPDMGIFNGYGAGYYFICDDREHGPYDTREEAERVEAEMLKAD